MDNSDASKVEKASFSRRRTPTSRSPASANPRQDGAQETQPKHIDDYIIHLREELLEDFKKTFLQKLLDDFKMKLLQDSNLSDPASRFEECRITCAATLILKSVSPVLTHEEDYKWSLTSGIPPIFEKLENQHMTVSSEDQNMTGSPTHNPEKSPVRTTNDAKKGKSKVRPLNKANQQHAKEATSEGSPLNKASEQHATTAPAASKP